MTRWLTTLFLMMAFSGGIFAGAPLLAGDPECSMDCCHKARVGRQSSSEVAAANICCAVFCPQSGSTPASVKIPQFTPLVVVALDAAALSKPSVIGAKNQLQRFTPKVSLKLSKPIFILHHALLI